MKRKMAFLMAMVMLATAPANAVLASENEVLIIGASDSTEIITEADGTEEDSVEEDSMEEMPEEELETETTEVDEEWETELSAETGDLEDELTKALTVSETEIETESESGSGTGTGSASESDDSTEAESERIEENTEVISSYALIANTTEDIEINETHFSDEIFRDYISANFDKDENGFLSESEIDEIVEIDVNGKGISSLKGIEFFDSLEVLLCKAYHKWRGHDYL